LEEQLNQIEKIEEEVLVEEGIFIFRQGGCCSFQIPVDEQFYLKHFMNQDALIKKQKF